MEAQDRAKYHLHLLLSQSKGKRYIVPSGANVVFQVIFQVFQEKVGTLLLQHNLVTQKSSI